MLQTGMDSSFFVEKGISSYFSSNLSFFFMAKRAKNNVRRILKYPPLFVLILDTNLREFFYDYSKCSLVAQVVSEKCLSVLH